MDKQARPSATGPLADTGTGPFARRDALRAIAGLGLAASGCGGGTDLAGVGTGGTGQVAFSSGPISGFGSVIVNGLKFDDTVARVTDDADRVHALGQLSIGMLVEIDGRLAEDGASGVAERIRVVSELRGPVSSIDAAGGRFTVLGTLVQTGSATVFPDARGLADLAVGTVVEVHGFRSPDAAVLRATLVAMPVGATTFKLRGTVAGRDGDGGGFRVGGLAIDPRGATVTNAPAGGLRNGMAVRLEGTAAPVSGVWRPDAILVLDAGTQARSGVQTRIEGTVTSFRSASDLVVAGVPVDASGATFTGGLAAASLRDGLRLRVLGTTTGGGRVLASVVQPRDDDAVDGSGDDDAEFAGTIDRFSSPADFRVRDRTGRPFAVDASKATLPPGTTLTDLKIGVRVAVKGRRGSPFVATSLKIER